MQRTPNKAKESATKSTPKNVEKPKTSNKPKAKASTPKKERSPKEIGPQLSIKIPARQYRIAFHTSGTLAKAAESGVSPFDQDSEDSPYDSLNDDELRAYLDKYHKVMPLHLVGGGGSPLSLLDQAWNSFVNGNVNDLAKYLAFTDKADLDDVLKRLNKYDPTNASADDIKGLLRSNAPLAVGCHVIGGKQMEIKSYNDKDLGPAINIKTHIPIAALRNVNGVLTVVALGTSNWDNNSIRLGPDDLGGRAAALAALYARWRAHHYEISFSPGCPATTPGMIACGITTDAYFNEQTAGDLSSILQLVPSEMGSVWSPMKIRLESHADGAALYTDGDAEPTSINDERLTNAGKFMIIAAGLDTTQASQFLGTLMVCVDISLYSPNPSNGVTLSAILRRNMGSKNYDSFMSVLMEPGKINQACEAIGLKDPEKVQMVRATISLTKQKLSQRRKSIDKR